jgi:hypothetical protein
MGTILKKDNSIFPKITDLKSAQAVGRQGAIACLLLILSAIALPLLMTYPDTSSISRDTIVGSAIYGILMILIYRMSRVGAVITLVAFTISIVMTAGSLPIVSWLIVVIYFLCFINGVRGTFAYHRIRKERQAEIDRPEEVSISE